MTSNLNLEYTYLNELNLEQHKTTLIETYDFLLHIPEIDSIQQIESSIEVYSTNQMSLSIKQNVENQIDKKLTNIYLLQSGINPDQIKKSQSKSRIKTYVVDEQGENTKGNSEASFGIGLVGGFLIYIFIFMYGTMVMRSVIEEKTNRIVEIIISSVSTFELMMAKIIGIGLVGITQFIIWTVVTFIMSLTILPQIIPDKYNPASQLETDKILENSVTIDPSNEILQFIIYEIQWPYLILFFILFFLGGYFLYSGLMAAIGAAVDEEADTQPVSYTHLTLPTILLV